MNVTVSVTTGTRINVTATGPRAVDVAPVENQVNVSTSSRDIEIANPITIAQIDAIYYPRSNPSGFATGVDGNLFVRKTESGQFYPISNPSGFITSGQAAGVQSLNISGGLTSGVVIFTGIGGLIISKTGQLIVFSGGAGNTGATQNLTNVVFTTGDQTVSGIKIFSNNIGVDNILSASAFDDVRIDLVNRQLMDGTPFQTVDWNLGQLNWNGTNSLNWANQTLSGTWRIQNLIISGQSLVTGGPYASIINFTDFVTGLPSGIDTLTVSFPSVLASQPIISCEFQNDIDSFIYSHAISSVSISGFIVNFSDILSATGYKLHTRVTI
jgi:hypothetical protein